MNEREYIIILKDSNDLEQFYDDMESKYGDQEIPDRIIECAYRRPNSRSTHYYLTDEEAQQVAADSRVESIEIPINDKGLTVSPLININQNGNWSKSSTVSSTDLNWALKRSYDRVPTPNWGSNGTTTITGNVSLSAIGRNVDVVIVDGHLVDNHPEWAQNEDGTGDSRFNKLNWFQYHPQVIGGSAGTYVYDFLNTDIAINNNNHGNNVASIACGSKFGWAKGANIYNISPYSDSTINSSSSAVYIYNVINYIRVWHANKPINPVTGTKNPTIINCSWGISLNNYIINNSTRIYFRNKIYSKPSKGWTATQRDTYGLINGDYYAGTTTFGIRDASIDADIADAIADGIIVVGASGNFSGYNGYIGDANGNNALSIRNSLNQTIPFYYYHRGPSPGCSSSAICVGAIDSTVREQKISFSNTGPRVDIHAPGSNIVGAGYTFGVADPRNSNYKIYKANGTSQAAPQVTGVLACKLEVTPTINNSQAKQFIRAIAGGGYLYDLTSVFNASTWTDWKRTDVLMGGPNLYLNYDFSTFVPIFRPETGQLWPRTGYLGRASSGQLWPRIKTVRK